MMLGYCLCSLIWSAIYFVLGYLTCWAWVHRRDLLGRKTRDNT